MTYDEDEEEDKIPIYVSKDTYEKIKKYLEGTDFESIDELIEYVLSEVLEEEEFEEEECEEI